MLNNRRVIVWTPYGRRRTYSLLIEYLKRDVLKGIVDEVWAFMNTDRKGQEDDIAYAHELDAAHDWFHLKERPDDCPHLHPKQLNTGFAYRHFTDPDAIYIRMDDDLVWLHEDAIRNLAMTRMVWGDSTLAAFPIIVNNAVCSFFLQAMGRIPGKDDGWDVVATPYCMDDVGWRDGNFAVQLHRYTLDHIAADTVHEMFMHHAVQLSVGQQFSVSCFATRGSDYGHLEPVGNLGPIGYGVEEEHWHTVQRSRELDIPNAIVPNSLVVHWSFHHQHKELNASGLLDQYRKLAEAVNG